MCTYENWPKSLKCSMCAQARENNGDNDRGGSCNKFLNDKENIDECSVALSNNTLSNNTVNNKHRYQLGMYINFGIIK